MAEVWFGIGLGIIFRAKASTGGTDLLVNLIKAFSKRFNTSNLLIGIDIVIIAISLIAFKEIEIGLYSSIAILVSGRMIDIVFEGINFSKTLFIISDKTEEIAKRIMDEFEVRSNSSLWRRTI